MKHATKAALYFLIAGMSFGGLLVTWGFPLWVLALINAVALAVLTVVANHRVAHVED